MSSKVITENRASEGGESGEGGVEGGEVGGGDGDDGEGDGDEADYEGCRVSCIAQCFRELYLGRQFGMFAEQLPENLMESTVLS